MIYCKPIEYPPAPFQPGDRVRFIHPESFEEGGSHDVIASSHTHTQLEGMRYAVANWQLRRTHKSRKKSTGESRKQDRGDCVTIDSKFLRSSENPLKDTRP